MRGRIVRSISASVGRPVEAAWVSLRFLPQPGFELKQFVVHDDPRFGAEPVLQAPEVAVVVRVWPLLRGKLEIARLSFSEPSLNLVRNGEGKWNVSSLLEKTSQSSTVGNGKAVMFPYMAAEDARVNLKIGDEKKPFALIDADFALWQDSKKTWGVRLKAQPVRADFNLSDTGTIKLEGSWRSAPQLREIPLQFQVSWFDAQLGQGTKLLLGADKGWRGELRIDTELSGTLEDLGIQTQASVSDFRRYDIANGSSLRLATKCTAHYSVNSQKFSPLGCQTPIGDGQIALNGDFSLTEASYGLTLSAQNVPLQALANLAIRTKRNLPQDLAAAGSLEADLSFSRSSSGEAQWMGGGQAVDVQLSSKSTQGRVYLDAIPFTMVSGTPLAGKNLRTRAVVVAPPHIEVGPLNLELLKAGLTSVKGTIDHSGYSFQIQGESDISHLICAAKTAGLSVPPIVAEGLASSDINISGKWAGFAPPLVTGKLQLHGVRAQVRGLTKPLEIPALTVMVDADEARVLNLAAQFGGSLWRGNIFVPRRCDASSVCPVRFDLHSDEIRADALWRAFENPSDGPWYKAIYPQKTTASFLTTMQAEGTIASRKVIFCDLIATQVSGRLKIDERKLAITHLAGEALGGHHLGEWTGDFSMRPPVYNGSGTLDHALLGQLAAAMNDDWVQGTVSGTYRISASGWNTSELLKSTMGEANWEARNGLLTHVSLSQNEPLRFDTFSGRLRLREGIFQLTESKLQRSDGIYQVSGTASMRRVLNLKLIRDGGHGFSVTGPLNDPHVVAAKLPETQAALKP
jgi:hypothetical protein